MEDIKNLASVFELARLLKVSKHWIYTHRHQLSHIEIGGRDYFRIKECKEIKPEIYWRHHRDFIDPKKFNGITFERAVADSLDKEFKKANTSYSQFKRDALVKTYLGK